MGIRKTKEIAVDLLMDFAGGLLIAIGVYNFAAASEFPVAGISGIALIFYHFFDIPIGIMTVLLNIPIILICYKLLGRTFFLKTLKTMAIATFSMDILAPLLPVAEGGFNAVVYLHGAYFRAWLCAYLYAGYFHRRRRFYCNGSS